MCPEGRESPPARSALRTRSVRARQITSFETTPSISPSSGLHSLALLPKPLLLGENGAGQVHFARRSPRCRLNAAGGSRHLRFKTALATPHRGVLRSCWSRSAGHASSVPIADHGPPLLRAFARTPKHTGPALHDRSVEEALMAVVTNRLGGAASDLFDEPEAAFPHPPMLWRRCTQLVRRGSQLCWQRTHNPLAYPDSPSSISDGRSSNVVRDTDTIESQRFLRTSPRC